MTSIPAPLPRVLAPLLADLRATLGDGLVGAYLFGSPIAGDFDPEASDLDLLVVVGGPLDATPLANFQGLIDRLVAREPDWADRLDIAFVDRPTLGTFRAGGVLLEISHEEPLAPHAAPDWLQTWFFVRTASTALLGPPASDLIPPIETGEFLEAVIDGVDGLIARLSVSPRAGSRAYLVLTLGRTLQSIESRAPCSKAEGAAWIAARFPDARPLVKECLEIRRSRGRLGFSAAGALAYPGLVDRLGAEIRSRRG